MLSPQAKIHLDGNVCDESYRMILLVKMQRICEKYDNSDERSITLCGM